DQAEPRLRLAVRTTERLPFSEPTRLTTSARGMLKEKVDPSPGFETSHSRPHIAPTSWRAMYRPRPVPPVRRPAPFSTREDRPNTRLGSDRRIPAPRSGTETPP